MLSGLSSVGSGRTEKAEDFFVGLYASLLICWKRVLESCTECAVCACWAMVWSCDCLFCLMSVLMHLMASLRSYWRSRSLFWIRG